jgi:hypothetical protein
MIDKFLHLMFDNNSQATKILFFQILGIVSVYILSCGCSEEPAFDPQIPMEIACADCGKYVSQRDEECDNCDFLVSNSIAVFKENEKAKKEEPPKQNGSMPAGLQPPPFILGEMKFFLRMPPIGRVPAEPN